MKAKCIRPDIRTVKIGDEALLPIDCITNLPPQKGKVVYIDPKKRFMTVEFDNSHIRESYCAYGPIG